jgi:CRP-like cAMP-binding protein
MASPTPVELANTGLFASLDESKLAIVAAWFEVEDAVPGQRLTVEGTAGYAFFILHEGSAEASTDGHKLADIQPGDFFGELAMLGDSGKRTATVTVTAPSVVWTMFGTRYRELEQQHPEIAHAIATAATERRTHS